jgi:DUF2075 family protein
LEAGSKGLKSAFKPLKQCFTASNSKKSDLEALGSRKQKILNFLNKIYTIIKRGNGLLDIYFISFKLNIKTNKRYVDR